MKRSVFISAILTISSLSLISCSGSKVVGTDDGTQSPVSTTKWSQYFVTTDWVDSNKSSIILIDTRSPSEYAAGHIEGAINFHYLNYTYNRIEPDGDTVHYKIPTATELTAIVNSLGIKPTSKVVAYGGDVDWGWSARFIWTLKAYGHLNAVSVDGGLPKWQYVDRRPVVTTATTLRPNTTSYTFSGITTLLATKEQVAAAIGDPNVILFDIRTPGEYAGYTVGSSAPIANPRLGHIPGAIFINWQDVLTDNAAGITYTPSGTSAARKVQVFKSATALQQSFDALGIRKDKTIIPYCEGGIRSSQYTQVLLALDYPIVLNYDGSWNEWSRQDSTGYPAVKGTNP